MISFDEQPRLMRGIVGKVYLVGAGPGDPGLLTLRGAECLESADIVLYDYLASDELLGHTRSGTELVCLGHHGRGRLVTQTEINSLMVCHARQGRAVVRLKGGDPMVFARVAEELAALEAAGVPYEIVPGVSAAQGASSYASVPLTHRDSASCVAFVTGHESGEKCVGQELDFSALARFPGTLVFYMGVTTAPQWSRGLIACDKPPDTPVAIVRRCTFPDQHTYFTTLGDVTSVIADKQIRPPAIIVVGDVARQRNQENWFTKRPLFGRAVLVTRPEHQADKLVGQLRILGANVFIQPAIEISEPSDWAPVDSIIRRMAEFDWLVFSSANGVHYFMRRLLALGCDMRQIGHARLAAIGPATVEALAEYHLTADVRPDAYRAEALAETLAAHARGRRFFLARASRGREVLAEILTAAGAKVEQAVVYDSRDVVCPNAEVANALAAGRVHWATVTSSAIARSLVGLFGDALRQTHLAAISPVTAEVLRELGHPPAVVADTFTTHGILDAILAAEGQAD
jgi:uroporphyrinogen III methyltransferase/synthase